MILLRRLALTASVVPLVLAAATAQAQGVPITEKPAGQSTPDQAASAADQVHASPTDGAAAGPDTTADIIVTGSSLRGVAPVGSNLVSVGRAELEDIAPQTVQQVLKTVPAVTGLQSTGQGSFGSADGAGTNAPTIHGLGASASNSTLVLINGHRLPVSGINHVLADPNILAPMAIERVEVLADGASSVYGSDAVAGVINFITRRKYDGLDATIQRGFGHDYDTFNAGLLAGKTWDTGSLLVSYNFSDRSALAARDRSFTRADHRSQGGTNFANFACSPATITAGGLVYYSPYTAGSGVANNAVANGRCDPSQYWDIVPQEKRHSVFASMHQEVGDKFNASFDVIYSDRKNHQNVSRGSTQATIFGPGTANAAQVNPFFTLPGGVVATSEAVNFDANTLFGRGAYIASSAETFYAHADGEYEITDTWRFNFGGVYGHDQATQFNSGQLNNSAFNLAVNGTTNGGGNVTAASIPGTSTIVLNTPLTTANAFDPYGVPGRTSSAVLARLIDNNITQIGTQNISNAYAKIDGSLFDLPGGAARIAVGGEYIHYTLRQDITRANNTGPASTGSTSQRIDYRRSVRSAFVELYFPIIGPEAEIPFVRRLDLNLSGRYDKYSDFGSTKNPKVAANLEVVDGVKFRGNYAESFVAPALTSRGSNAAGLTGESGFAGVNGSGLPGGSPNVLIANFPGVQNIPGASCTATACTLGANVTGIQLSGGNGNLRPQTGQAYSFGVDLTPRQVPGLRLSLTYWVNKLRGGITAPQTALALGAADLSYLLQLYPAGATQAQIAAATAGLPQTASLNANTYFIYNFQQQNVLNLDVAGIDGSVNYQATTDYGKFSLGAGFARKTRFDQFFGTNGTKFSVLGTAGFNTTFPSVKFEGRANVGWEIGGLEVNTYFNYLGKYRNYSGTAANPVTRTNGVPTGGGDVVRAFKTMDLNISYKLKDIGFLSEGSVFVDTTNLFDRDPPFYNTYALNGASGYDPINASPIGRVVTLGVRTKF